jgi:hypothetical protein
MALILGRGSRSVSQTKERKIDLLYADFVVGGRNSMIRPRSFGESHFAGFENLIGM